MLKLTKTGIGLLTKQYRSVLRKCILYNLGLFATTTLLTTMAPKISYSDAMYNIVFGNNGAYYIDSSTGNLLSDNGAMTSAGSSYVIRSNGNYIKAYWDGVYHYDTGNSGEHLTGVSILENIYRLDVAFNYYYTFRVDDSNEVIEFTLFLNNEKLSSVFDA